MVVTAGCSVCTSVLPSCTIVVSMVSRIVLVTTLPLEMIVVTTGSKVLTIISPGTTTVVSSAPVRVRTSVEPSWAMVVTAGSSVLITVLPSETMVVSTGFKSVRVSVVPFEMTNVVVSPGRGGFSPIMEVGRGDLSSSCMWHQ